MIILGVAAYRYVLWTMRQLKKPAGSPLPERCRAVAQVGADADRDRANLGVAPDPSAAHAHDAQISIARSVALRSTLTAQIGGSARGYYRGRVSLAARRARLRFTVREAGYYGGNLFRWLPRRLPAAVFKIRTWL
jgi:hypothetical protein